MGLFHDAEFEIPINDIVVAGRGGHGREVMGTDRFVQQILVILRVVRTACWKETFLFHSAWCPNQSHGSRPLASFTRSL
jgi:hypothetical protein